MTQSTYRPDPVRCPDCSSTRPGIHRHDCPIVRPLEFTAVEIEALRRMGTEADHA